MSGSREEYSFLSVSYLRSGFLGGGWAASVPGEEVWTFPSYCVSAAGGGLDWLWSNAPPCFSCTWLAVVGRYLTRLDGRRSEIEVFNQFGCRSILVTATPFFPAKFISPHTWDFGEFLTLVSQTFLHWICIFFCSIHAVVWLSSLPQLRAII